MRTLCAWCGVVMAEGETHDGPVSHGCCAECMIVIALVEGMCVECGTLDCEHQHRRTNGEVSKEAGSH